MLRFFLKLFFLICLIFLNSCASLGLTNELPTLMPDEYVPTAIAMTAEALVTPSNTPDPTATFTPEPTQVVVAAATIPPQATQAEQAAPVPTISENTLIPGAEIQIANPGPLSKVGSPLSIIAYVTPGADGNAQVELWGEDGRLMYRRVCYFFRPKPQRGMVVNFSPGVQFFDTQPSRSIGDQVWL